MMSIRDRTIFYKGQDDNHFRIWAPKNSFATAQLSFHSSLILIMCIGMCGCVGVCPRV